MKSTLRATLREGRPTFDSWLQSGNFAAVPITARVGCDWLSVEWFVAGLS